MVDSPILKLTVPEPNDPVLIRKGWSTCGHSHCELDMDTRSVNCRKCGAVVDPFDHLVSLSKEGLRLDNKIHDLKRATERYNEMCLKKQVTCKHKRATTFSDGKRWCPSCGLDERSVTKIGQSAKQTAPA